VVERPAPPQAALPVPVAAPDGQYAAGLRALQEAFAIDIAEREDRHRGEMQALQQSFTTDVAARDNHHRSELQAMHQRFTADVAARDERHRGEVTALHQQIEELRGQLNEAAATRGREAEARATAEAELEWHRGELHAHRDEITRLKTQATELGTSLTGAQQHGERWTQEARRLEAELQKTRSEAEQAAANAAGQLDNTTRQLKDTAARLADTQEQAARLAEQSAALEVAGSQLRQTIGEQRAVRERLTAERDTARQQAAEIESQLRTAEFEAEQAAEEAARQLNDAMRRIEAADEHAARLAGHSAVHEATAEELRNVLAEQQGELKRVSLEHDAATLRIHEVEAELAMLQRQAEVVPAEEPGEPAARPTAKRAKSATAQDESAATDEEPAESEDADDSDRPVAVAEGLGIVGWQRDALAEWARLGYRGVIEAISDQGLTRVAYWAIGQALDQDMKVLVLVPTAERAERWYADLRNALPINRVGKHLGAKDAQAGTYDVVVSTAHAAARERVFDSTFKGLLVADEVHEFGTPDLSLALDMRYAWRLGITDLYERDDDGLATYVDPYFGGVGFSLGYDRALADEVIAPFDLALVSVRFNNAEQAEWDRLGKQANELANTLVKEFAVPAEPSDRFTAGVSALAAGRLGPARTAARSYDKTLARRSELVAVATAKESVLKTLAARIRDTGPALLFADNQQAANQLAKVFSRESLATRPVHGGLLIGARGSIEGAVADVELGIVVTPSANKRLMIERLGRVIRTKPDGGAGHLVVLYAEGTAEAELTSDEAPFIAMVTPQASAVKRLTATEPGALAAFLARSADPDA
jgi:superfamily II DNA or RNA helicase